MASSSARPQFGRDPRDGRKALTHANLAKHHARVAEVLRAVIAAADSRELRRQAGAVLSEIPGGTAPFYDAIQSALDRQDHESALELIESGLEIFQNDVTLFWWRGRALLMRGALRDAATSFNHAAELRKDVAIIPQAVAETSLKLGDYSGAVEAARRATQIAPHDADAQATLALSYYRAGDMHESITATERALESDPVQPYAIWIAVLAHLRNGDADAARSSFQHAQLVSDALSPGLDASFRSVFLKELEAILADQDNGSVAAEIKQAVGLKDSSA